MTKLLDVPAVLVILLGVVKLVIVVWIVNV